MNRIADHSNEREIEASIAVKKGNIYRKIEFISGEIHLPT
jgi:hypothetical protein